MNWKISATFSFALAVLFVGVGGWRFGFEVRTVALLAVLGVTVGVLAAPEFERKPRVTWVVGAWQALAGLFGGVCVALLVAPSAEAMGIGALLGGLVGFLAPAWLRHVQLP